jgi:hypothetical protein
MSPRRRVSVRPSASRRALLLHRLDGAFLRGGEREGQGEQECHEHERGDQESGERGAEAPAAGECLPGQTDQDRPGSAEAGEQIAEAEEPEAEHGTLAPHPRLAAKVAVHRRFEATQVDRQPVELDQPKHDQEHTDGEADDAARGAGEGDIGEKAPADERDQGADTDQEGGAPIDSAAAKRSAGRTGRPREACACSASGRASMVTSSGNEQGEKNDATPAAAARTRSPAPAPAGRSKRG